MSLAVFHIQTSNMPPNENSISKHMGMLFLKKNLPKTTREGDSLKNNPRKNTLGSMFFFQNYPCRPSEWATNFENFPCRPSDWASFSENIPCRPSERATNFENYPRRPSDWAFFSENTLANGSEAGFSQKTTKTILAFRRRFIPAQHATRSRLPGNAFHNSLPLHKRLIAV